MNPKEKEMVYICMQYHVIVFPSGCRGISNNATVHFGNDFLLLIEGTVMFAVYKKFKLS